MNAIRFCPFCGSDDLRYHDEDVPQYAFCRGCDKWVGATDDFTLEDIRFITSKIKQIKRTAEQIKRTAEQMNKGMITP